METRAFQQMKFPTSRQESLIFVDKRALLVFYGIQIAIIYLIIRLLDPYSEVTRLNIFLWIRFENFLVKIE